MFVLDYSLRTCPEPSLLQIQITQTPIQRTHHLPNSSRLSSISHIKNIVEPSLPRRRLVGPSHVAVLASVHLIFLEPTATEIEQLPRSPQTIHLAVVDPECRIRRRSEQVAAWIAADDIVDAAVGSNFDGVRDAFREEAVLLDVGFCEEGWSIESVSGSQELRFSVRLTQHRAVIRISLIERRSNIPLETSRIVAQPAFRTGSRVVQTPTGPRLMDMFANGPVVTLPLPTPGGNCRLVYPSGD